jgi:heme exporter protein D
MGGHGLFVWGSYGVCLLVMTLEPLLAARRRRQALADAAAPQGNLSLKDEEDE